MLSVVNRTARAKVAGAVPDSRGPRQHDHPVVDRADTDGGAEGTAGALLSVADRNSAGFVRAASRPTYSNDVPCIQNHDGRSFVPGRAPVPSSTCHTKQRSCIAFWSDNIWPR